MKNGLLLFFTIAIILSSCKKDDDFAFDQSPDDRINAALTAYQTKLAGAENGWKALITVDSGRGGTFSFYLKFNDQNRVTMVSDFDSASAATPKESSYRLKAQQQPTLIFDTYSYIHVLADPNENVVIIADVNHGPVGQGLLSDFEFIFDNSQIQDDTIRMNGKVHGAKLVLAKASKAEADFFLGGQFTLVSDILSDKILTYFKRFTLGNQLYDVTLNESNRTITFTWVDGAGNPQRFTTSYYNINGGLQLKAPFTNGSLTITSFTDVAWDGNTNTLSLKAGGQAGTVNPVVLPLYVDNAAPYRWWKYSADLDDYWFSWLGYHLNGIDDYFGVTRLTGYGGMIFWSRYNLSGSTFYDAFSGIVNRALVGSATFSPEPPPATSTTITTFTDDGRIIFKLLGRFGSATSIFNTAIAAQTIIPEGYYLVQTSSTSYDMVSAKDGLAWITWEF